MNGRTIPTHVPRVSRGVGGVQEAEAEFPEGALGLGLGGAAGVGPGLG